MALNRYSEFVDVVTNYLTELMVYAKGNTFSHVGMFPGLSQY